MYIDVALQDVAFYKIYVIFKVELQRKLQLCDKVIFYVYARSLEMTNMSPLPWLMYSHPGNAKRAKRKFIRNASMFGGIRENSAMFLLTFMKCTNLTVADDLSIAKCKDA